MGDRVRVVHDEAGRLVAVKSAPPDDPDRTRREAAVLADLQHPGVVELVELHVTATGADMVTRWVGSRTAADLPRPVEPARTAGIVLAVASTLGDLHRLGVVHGGLDATHVLLDRRSRPVLCGFGEARRVDDTAPDDPGRPRPSTDVAGLGALLLDLLSDGDLPLPERRWTPPLSREGRRRSTQRRDLERLAHQALHDDPSCRPGIRALADAVHAAVPDAALTPHDTTATTVDPPAPRDLVATRCEPDGERPPRPTPTDPLMALLAEVDGHRSTSGSPNGASRPTIAVPLVTDRPPRRETDDAPHRPHAVGLEIADDHRPRSARWGGAALVLGLGLLGFFGASAMTEMPPPTPTEPGAAVDRAENAGPAEPQASSTTTPPVALAAPGTQPEVEHQGILYHVGQPGDLVVVDDWRCTGDPTPAVYRPSTGSVFVFPAWPGPTDRSDVAPLTSSPDGNALVTGPAGADGCPTLVVGHPDGRRTVIDETVLR